MLRILCAAVMAFALSSPALARHRAHHHFHRVGKMMVSRGIAENSLTSHDTDKRMFLSFGEATSARSARHARSSVEYDAGFSGTQVITVARSYLGMGAVFGRSRLWCARFMNFVLARVGYRGTGSDMAKSFLKLPRTSPHVGAIAVLGRHGGGHVGVVTGFDGRGNPIIISGNHGHHVAEARYPKQRVLAYVTAG